METVSSTGIEGGHRRVVTGVVGASALLVSLTAVFSLDGASLLAAMGIVALLLAVLMLVRVVRAEIAIGAVGVELRLRPFYCKAIPFQDVLGAAVSTDTSVAEGFGYRYLGDNRRGLLVGGSCVEIATQGGAWVVSCREADRIAGLIARASTGG